MPLQRRIKMKRSKYRRTNRLKYVLIAVSLVIIISISAIIAFRNHNMSYGFGREVPEAEQELRLRLVEAAENWLGSNEQDGSHRSIIDVYNSHEPLAQNYLVKYDDEWCATFVSASAINAGLTQFIPTECGCQRQIDLFKELGAWEEADDYHPLPGDVIYYCRNNKDLLNDCTGWSDHVGIVVGTRGNRIKVIEGNFGDKVDYRYLPINAVTIRGFGTPKYTK